MKINRRKFLQCMNASALSAATLGTLSTGLTSFSSHAEPANDYKALVCVFLLGGLDNHDLVVPYDTRSYDEYARIRASMLNDYGSQRQRSSLLPLSPNNQSDFDGRVFALPPEMANVHELFRQGNAAIIGNVGPLIQPTTKEQASLASVPLPPRLFSHNDQQAVWQAIAPEGAQFGWGGVFGDLAQVNNTNKEFTNISTSGSDLFLTGIETSPFKVSPSGAADIDLLNENLPEALRTKLAEHFGNSDVQQSNLIKQDVALKNNGAFSSNQKFSQAFADSTGINTSFPESPLGGQLRTVAQTIANRDTLGVSRQVFFVAIGGFDTHDEQAQDLPRLLTQIDTSIVAFNQAMIELGLNDQVTLFTASEFGRTLAVNGDGTDHGWGGHHLVVGGAVNGNHIYGQIPPSGFDHDWDLGGGRLLPSLSIEQMAAPLGRWFGLSDAGLQLALPNLANFPSSYLPFI